MSLQPNLPCFPDNGENISQCLRIDRHNGQIVFFNAAGPIYLCAEGDTLGIRQACALFYELRLANILEMANALELHKGTVSKYIKRYKEGGISALEPKNGIYRTSYKLDDDQKREAQELLNQGKSVNSVAAQLGISEGTIRHHFRKGWLKRGSEKRNALIESTPNLDFSSLPDLQRPRERALADVQSNIGIGVKRGEERVLASTGNLDEARPEFHSVEAVANVGVLLALPAIMEEGLLEEGKKVYGSLKGGFYGLQSILLLFVFMVLLRIKTPHQLSKHSPGELGILIGLDRIPEVKTFRSKLKEIGSRHLAHTFAGNLTRRWTSVDRDSKAWGYLYIDGHVRIYNGDIYTLPKNYVTQRRLSMPATTDYYVNGWNATPLFVITAEANDGLISMLDKEILPNIKKILDPGQRITIIFDRAGWSPNKFRDWYSHGFDVLTYRKGRMELWEESSFQNYKGTLNGKKYEYQLAERSVLMPNGFWMREVRRLREGGKQTSILSTKQDIQLEEIAVAMFSRWSQENFFSFMDREFNFDHRITYAIEQANTEREIPNPNIKPMKKALIKLQTQLKKAQVDHFKLSRIDTSNFKLKKKQKHVHLLDHLSTHIISVESSVNQLKLDIKSIPKRVTIKSQRNNEQEIIQLETERKMLSDVLKLLSYRAETSLGKLIAPNYPRNEEEIHSFCSALYQTTGDIIVDQSKETLTIRLYPLANPQSNEILHVLCKQLNEKKVKYPGTAYLLHFEGTQVAGEITRCPES